MYCKSNNLSTLVEEVIHLFIKKTERENIGDYNIVANLKSEENRKVDLKLLNDWELQEDIPI